MKSVSFKLSAIAFSAALALSLGACSDDSSGSGVTHGEFSVPIPDGLADDDGDSSASEEVSSASKDNSSESTQDSVTVWVDTSYDDVDESSSSEAKSSEAKSSEAKSSASSSASTARSWRDDCLDIINEYRATEGKPALSLASEEKQTCTDKQAADDLKENSAHGHFRACDEWAQNTGPNVNLKWKSDTVEIAKYYLNMMWDEKKLIESGERDPDRDEDYSYIGHYLNMSSTKYKTVSCGFATNSDNTTGWLNVNFY